MKIVENELGRVTFIYNPDEAKSPSDWYLSDAIKIILDRYGFLQYPDVSKPQTELKFTNGRIATGVKTIAIKEMNIYGDGIAATCKDTDAATLVLEDIMRWANS